MEDVFIRHIEINEVRHLKDVSIAIDETERKHLVITGKNGSGKTSLLLSIKDNLSSESETTRFSLGLESLKPRSSTDSLDIGISNNQLGGSHRAGNFILAYFNAKRNQEIVIPKGISKIALKHTYPIDEYIGQYFIQHLVNLKAESSFAQSDGDKKSAKKIETWFRNFEKSLRNLFDDEKLELIFDRKEYNFYFKLGDGNTPDINQLSDGYSSIMDIVGELILRMEKKSPMAHEVKGIVLIDELEAHLHVDLQKKILPFLTSFFPKIQFICTTHSPFVISSVENCVIYDLEKQIRIEDATGYSYDTIIESYFGSDKYSHKVTKKVEEFEKLALKSELSDNEKVKLLKLESYFEKVPRDLAPELDVKLQQIKLKQLNRKTG